MRRPALLSALLIFLFIACDRVVNIERPYPEKASFCYLETDINGLWVSDSVWVVTEVDSLDSTIVNKRPTLFYELDISCGVDTMFLLEYINYSGVVTREMISNNFTVSDSTIRLYHEVDFNRDSADYEIRFSPETDSTFRMRYNQQLNTDQRSEIFLWMKRE